MMEFGAMFSRFTRRTHVNVDAVEGRDMRSSCNQAVSVSRTCCHGAYEQLDLLGMLKDLQKLVLQLVVCKILQEIWEHIRKQSLELDVCWRNDWNTSIASSIAWVDGVSTNINGLGQWWYDIM